LTDEKEILGSLASLDLDKITIEKRLSETPDQHIPIVAGPVEILLPLSGVIDTAAEIERLTKELSNAEAQIKRLEGLLASPFASNAPTEVVEKERDRLANFQETAEKINLQIANMSESE
jgi:valyl-tRNA synthetase